MENPLALFYSLNASYFILNVTMPMWMCYDAGTNAWWLYVGGTAVGYWPETLFVALRDGADTITRGGEIFDSSGSGGFHTLTQMGSGHLAGEGYRKASHVRGFMYYNSNGQAVSPTQNDLVGYSPAPDCYNYSYQTLSSGSAVGYWPETLFAALRDGGDATDWGGEIVHSSGSGGFHTQTQMGSGHRAGEAYQKASHVRGP
ncbi:hypothetical protein Nepgr_017839 [Nepenthes gracilis]|uniref:Neprosin PEP catalytic domain-containing protein n=1 Tax=Nepenthes gracilis TaxID=150966 RepID=A0AAD3SR82_NEPGR|nr:hypothetical protein Nepgr_017839 [Nepenthes gracilis]